MYQAPSEQPQPPSERASISFTFGKKVEKVKESKEKDKVKLDFIASIQENEITSLNPDAPVGPLVIPLLDFTIKNEQPAALSAEDKEAAEALLKEAKQAQDKPLLMKNRLPGLENFEDEEDRLRYDVSCRPEATREGYDRVPVTEYGVALLRGMGWKPGDPIGLTNKSVVKPIEYVPRPHRLGLGGSVKAPEPSKKKLIKPGESREPKPIMVLPKDADGRQRHVKSIDEKLVPYRPEGIHPGNLVAIVSGVHDGMYGRVQSMDKSSVTVKFANDEVVAVSKSDLMAVDSTQLPTSHPAHSISKQQTTRKRKHSENTTESSTADKSKKKTKSRSRSKPVWVMQHIMVRIVSKSLDGGKYYRKKAKIVDVISGDVCVLMLENGKMLEGISQSQLESVLPDPGGTVLVVRGEGRGEKATLLEKSNSKGTALVQLQHDLSVRECSLDDVSTFTD